MSLGVQPRLPGPGGCALVRYTGGTGTAPDIDNVGRDDSPV